MTMMIPIITLEELTFAYSERPTLFSNLNFSLYAGEHIGLHGPNGTGKTTLLRLIMGLESPLEGRILFRGMVVSNDSDLHTMRCNVGFVLQNSDDQLFSATVLEDVAFGPLNLGLKRDAARERALETLDSMGISHLADRSTHRLSVGEKKMVSIASVLSMKPQALLLDEPSASLDDAARDRIITVLKQQTIAMIVVSHDKDFLQQTSSSFLCIAKNGSVTEKAHLDDDVEAGC